MVYGLLKDVVKWYLLSLQWWYKKLGKKKFWFLMALSTILATYLNYKY